MKLYTNGPTASEEPERPPSPAIKVTSEASKTLHVRADSLGYSNNHHLSIDTPKIDSLNYIVHESEAWRAHRASEHFRHRGRFWNKGKRDIIVRYISLALIGITQGSIAYLTNITANKLTDNKYETVLGIMQGGLNPGKSQMLQAFLVFYFYQLAFAAFASLAVMIEPMAGGSGIPEVKVFLNGIDLPRITAIKTGICKIFGVIGSVCAGLPVGKEGPMVHSGAVVATAITSGKVRDDKERRDYVACGAAAGVCTAFSAPIGGILFALEEGASFWTPSITFRTFFCSASSIATLYALNSIGIQFGKVGFDKLFSFGNFIFEDGQSSYAVFELGIFLAIGVMGGLIGACFNAANEAITIWRIKFINHTPLYRFIEVLCVSSLVSLVSFGLPFFWNHCQTLPDMSELDDHQKLLLDNFVSFNCVEGEEYNELASLIFNDGNAAIKLLFHMHQHTFSLGALSLFFSFYITLAVVTYGIAVPSGLFVPSLLAGAAFGRLFGNLVFKMNPTAYAFSNTYSLIGAAAVLGGMARMTISLTVILLEATGNEQFALPLMITLFTARVVGSLFNDDLYHIHIHLKKGVHFLEAELRSITGNHNLMAGHIMSAYVAFVRPIEKVSVVLDMLTSCEHTSFPVVDTQDKDILFGTIDRNVLCTLLAKKAYGLPSKASTSVELGVTHSNHIELKPYDQKFVPLVQWSECEKEYPRCTSVKDIHVPEDDRELLMDLRPYANTAPYSIQETASVQRTYALFRSLGCRLLLVVNRYNQCVGTISRDDLTNESLAQHMLTKGKHV